MEENSEKPTNNAREDENVLQNKDQELEIEQPDSGAAPNVRLQKPNIVERYGSVLKLSAFIIGIVTLLLLLVAMYNSIRDTYDAILNRRLESMRNQLQVERSTDTETMTKIDDRLRTAEQNIARIDALLETHQHDATIK